MVQERGGLDYKIIFVTDAKDAEEAKERITEIKKSIDKLRKAKNKAARAAKRFTLSQTELGREVKKLNALTRSQISIAEKQNKITAQEATEQRVLVKALKEKRATLLQLKSLQRQLATSRRSIHNKEIRDKRIELEVQKRITRAITQTAVARKLATQGRDIRGLTAFDRTAQGLDRQAKSFKRVGKEAKTAQSQVNRISFTFRRLFGILAAFAAARAGLQLIRSLFSTAIKFSAEIETAALGIAAVIAAAGDVRGATGEAGDAAQRFALAQRESRRQLSLLRRDVFTTAAGLEELTKAFETATGPGLQAGFNLDEIRQFTVRISQAATAIGLQQNQLAEEIRSILTGNIRARTTFIATALGITNADIRQARELGTLVEFLREKFEAFGIAGQEALTTLGPLFTNAGIAIKTLIEQAAPEFFQEIKNLLLDIQNIILPLDDANIRIINPEAVEFAREIFDAVAGAVEQARILVRALDFSRLQSLTSILGTLISNTFLILGNIIQGVVLGLTDAARILRVVFDILDRLGLTDIFNIKNLALALAQLARIGTILLSIKAVSFVIVRTWKGLTLLWVGLKAAVLAVRGAILGASVAGFFFNLAMAPTLAIVGAIVIAVLAIATAFKPVRDLVKSIASFLGDVLGDILGLGFADLSEDIEDSVKKTEQITTALDGVRAAVISVRREFELTLDIVEKLDKGLRDARTELSFAKFAAGAGGLLTSVLRQFSTTNKEIDDQILKISRERDIINSDLLGAQQKVLDIELKINNLSTEQNELVAGFVNNLEQAAARETEILELVKKIAKIKEIILRAEKFGRGAADARREEKQLEDAKKLAKFRIKVQEDELKKGATKFDPTFSGVLPDDKFTLARKQAEELKSALASRAQLADKVRDAELDILKIRTAVGLAGATRAATITQARVFQLKQERVELEANLILRDLEFDEIRAITTIEKENLKLKADILDIDTNRTLLANRKEAEENASRQLQLNLDILKEDLKNQFDKTDDLKEQEAITKNITATLVLHEDITKQIKTGQDNLNLAIEEEIALRKIIEFQQQRLDAQRDAPVVTGFKRAFEEIRAIAQTSFEIIRDTIVGITIGAASAISNALTDALMPDGAPIKEHFSRLFRAIGNEIVKQLLIAGIAKALFSFIPGQQVITGLTGGPGSKFGAVSTILNFVKGGNIPHKGKASLAHYTRGHGLTEGGPPPGISPKDTVPIWAQPGEFMMKLGAVGKYGLGIMSALNQGLINPTALQSLVAHRSQPARKARLVPSYATGGGVSAPAPAQGSRLVAALPATESTMADILNGGGKALERWLLEKGFSNQPNERDTNFFR